jgi:serine/threonine protein kinase
MPAPATVADFIDVVRKSGLVAEDKLSAAVDRMTADPAPPTTSDQVAQALVRDGLLSRFQARQLKLGRYKRFMVAGKYRLLELLGAGGMGAVYLCEHILMRRLVALKVLPAEKLADPSNQERFYREARAVAALNHPNIVRAYDIDKYDTMHFLVMEYVDGRSLQELVALYGRMDPNRAANYIAQAASALQYASELSMVHRDIKPGNLLLERSGTIKLLDMGLARFFNDTTDNLTARYDDNCVLGTADYLAPEQAMSNVVDIRADIYALGGTLYYMLTGQAPAHEGTVAQKLVFHQTQMPKPVSEFRDDVPAGLVAVLWKMLAKRPEDRYQTPEDVANSLAPWADQYHGPPPAAEMPDLCPLVLNLAGSTFERRAGSSRVAGSARSRAGGTAEMAALGLATATGGESSRVVVPDMTNQSGVSTGRSSVTAPIPQPPSGPGGAVPSAESIDLLHPDSSTTFNQPFRPAPPKSQSLVWAAVGLAVGLVVVAIVAYLLLAGR